MKPLATKAATKAFRLNREARFDLIEHKPKAPMALGNRPFVKKRIPVPLMDEYPLKELSNPKTNFIEASIKFPELEEQFLLLDKVQKTFQSKKHYFFNSVCIVRTLNDGNFIQVIINCSEDHKHIVETKFRQIGL